MAAPRVGKVRIDSADPKLSVTFLLGDERPDVSSGYGGWEEVTRPRRPPITTFRAPTGLHLTLALLLDGFAADESVEDDIADLTKMARAAGRDGLVPPPRVTVTATGGAVPYTDRTWVIGELQWGDAEMNTRGNRTRQAVTVTLYEYVEDVYLTEKSAAQRQRTKQKEKTKQGAPAKRITAKRAKPTPQARTLLLASTADFGAGEDLLSIAARELGDADRWIEIAQLNGMRDPRAVTPGQVLRLP